ncbi:hypothetical protein HQ529_02835 [Candidatus Woesearchaeota archaeon]|nr:hypothetical protein [Candidatus Woesearchaeota archaeon]
MERFQLEREKALKHLRVADHMLTQTYPLVKDPKLLIAVLENIFRSLSSAMSSILYYERLFKRIPPFSEDFDSMFNTFKARCTRRYDINIEYITLIQNIKDLIQEHKKSPVEFARKDKFVITTESYHLRIISTDKIKEYISKAKLFIEEMNNMVSKNDGIFR